MRWITDSRLDLQVPPQPYGKKQTVCVCLFTLWNTTVCTKQISDKCLSEHLLDEVEYWLWFKHNHHLQCITSRMLCCPNGSKSTLQKVQHLLEGRHQESEGCQSRTLYVSSYHIKRWTGHVSANFQPCSVAWNMKARHFSVTWQEAVKVISHTKVMLI